MIRSLNLLIIGYLLCTAFANRAEAQVTSIQSFVEIQDKWDNLVDTKNWTLEGRYSLMGNGRLMFKNCKMPFRFAVDVTRPSGQFTNLRVSGAIQRDSGRLFFNVKSISKMPSDLETFRLRKLRLDSTDFDGMYELAEWGESRAKFYDDDELLEQAQKLKQTGLHVELREIQSLDQKQLEAFLAKAKQLKLGEELIHELLHRGYWDQYQELKKLNSQTPAYAELLVSISKNLPGATTPLAENKYSKEAIAAYLNNPLQSYETANSQDRLRLNRFLHLVVAVDSIEASVAETGLNGFQIARQLRELAPERKDLIEKYETMELEFLSERLESMTRSEMLELSTRYQERGETERAREIRSQWLSARESIAREDGARGLVDYAQEWLQLLNTPEGKATAAKYYMEAWVLNPQYPLARDWLEKNGYALYQGKWVPSRLLPATQESQIEIAIREGRPEKGMAPQQVKAAMGIEPDSVVRFASAGKVTELWTYKAAGIMIHFEWSKGDDHSAVQKISSTMRRDLK